MNYTKLGRVIWVALAGFDELNNELQRRDIGAA